MSHRRAALQRADQILVLRDCHLDAQGTLAEVRQQSEEFRRLWEQTT
ncbi:MAG TPA: hypothetical protein VFZ25_14635 [Chloroflexota bacterium]|nr:hypothetical protein [Chloroflexota bacterium]